MKSLLCDFIEPLSIIHIALQADVWFYHKSGHHPSATTAVNTDDSISINIKATNAATVPLPSLLLTTPFPLSQPVCPLPASPPTPATTSALTAPLPPPPLSQPSSPVHPSPAGPSTLATAFSVTPAAPSKALQEAVSWPSWFADAHAFLSSQNLGPDFAFLIERFTDLE